MDYKWLLTTLITVVGFTGIIVGSGAFLWRSHLQSVVNEWKAIAEARAVTIVELTAHNLKLEEQNTEIIANNEELRNWCEMLLRELAAAKKISVTRLENTLPARTRKLSAIATSHQGRTTT